MFDSSLKRIVSNDSAFGGSNTDTTDSGHLEDLEEVLHESCDDVEEENFVINGNQTTLKVQDSQGIVRMLSKREEKQRGKSVHRLVTKDGKQRIKVNLGCRLRNRKVMDFFTSVVDYNWCFLAIFITLGYFTCWLIFATLWSLLYYVHDYLSLTKDEESVCVQGMNNFGSSILFSMELQQTIGYGSRVPSDQCPEAIILQGVQTVIGLLLDAALIGIFFAKIARPATRALTVVWSKNAVVTLRDGVPCLVWQVTDVQASPLVEAHFRAQLRTTHVTKEGEVLYNYMRELKVTTQIQIPSSPPDQAYEDRAMMVLPVQVMHPIDEDSPLYNIHPAQFSSSQMEVVVVLEAGVEPSGSTTQAMTSYLFDEIIWGWRFLPFTQYNSRDRYFIVNAKGINSIEKEEVTPFISASEMKRKP